MNFNIVKIKSNVHILYFMESKETKTCYKNHVINLRNALLFFHFNASVTSNDFCRKKTLIEIGFC